MTEGAASPEIQRIDRWLWHVRISKTRSLAAETVSAGHVRVNREKVRKPSHAIRIGDTLTVTIAGRLRIVEVAGIVPRRVSAAIAATLYVDHSPPPPAVPDGQNLPTKAPSPGRVPSARERRALVKLQRGTGESETG